MTKRLAGVLATLALTTTSLMAVAAPAEAPVAASTTNPDADVPARPDAAVASPGGPRRAAARPPAQPPAPLAVVAEPEVPTKAPARPVPEVAPKVESKVKPVPSVREARAWARRKVGGAQFRCLDRLWTRESSWNPRARNPSSGAYGIPQALPARKMASAGSDWRRNPLTQVRWGLRYIDGRYGSPCAAWRHSQAHNWY